MSLTQAMEAAKNAASTLPATQDSAPVPVRTYGTSLDDFLSGGARPDMWIRVKDTGVWLDRNEKVAVADEGFEAVLDIDNLQFFVAARAEVGGKPSYIKSFDGGKSTDRGENFAIAFEDLKNNGEKFSGQYRGADIILIPQSNILQGKTTVEAGKRLGYSTPITGFFPLQSLIKQLQAQGKIVDAGGGRLTLTGDPVTVRVTHTMETNNSNQDYGVLHFELVS